MVDIWDYMNFGFSAVSCKMKLLVKPLWAKLFKSRKYWCPN